jgi:hypothetical protein
MGLGARLGQLGAGRLARRIQGAKTGMVWQAGAQGLGVDEEVGSRPDGLRSRLAGPTGQLGGGAGPRG